MLLDENQVLEAKEIYNKLINIYTEKADMQVLLKERENLLKEELATVLDIKNKDGETQPNKIKMPLVINVIDELIKKEQNKKDIEYDTMQEYKTAIKKELVPPSVVEGYVYCLDEIKATKDNIKEIFKESTLLDKDSLKAIDELAKSKYKEIYIDKMVDAGLSELKTEKDNSEFYEIKSEIEELLK